MANTTSQRTAFGIWLERAIRNRRSPNTGKYMTQQELADGIGVTQSAIHHIISGRRSPGADIVIRLANYLGEDVNSLLQLAEYEPITGSIVLSADGDPVALRIMKATREILRDRRQMEIAVAMLEAMLGKGGNNNADNGDSAPDVDRQARAAQARTRNSADDGKTHKAR